jgi:hypothetical protein
MKIKLMSVMAAVVISFVAACGGQTENVDEYVVLGKADGTIPAVQLMYAESWNHQKYGQSDTQKSFVIRVQNLSFHKAVAIHHSTKDGKWVDLAAKYEGPADASGKTELWKASTRDKNFGGQFVVKYSVDGKTFWDNNNGKDYKLGDEDGPMLGTGINVRLTSAHIYPSGRAGSPHISGVIDIRNIGFHKDIELHASSDGWKTETVIKPRFIGHWRTYGYSGVKNPNVHNVEGWSFDDYVGTGKTFEVYVKYTVNGKTYYDSNFGKNYTIERKF